MKKRVAIALMVLIGVLGLAVPALASRTFYDSHPTNLHIYDSHHEHVRYCADGTLRSEIGYDHWWHEKEDYVHVWDPSINDHQHVPLGTYTYSTDDHYAHTHYDQPCV